MKKQIIKNIISGLIVCTMVFTMAGNVFAEGNAPGGGPPGGGEDSGSGSGSACTERYFCDTETSTENEMVAGTLDFSLTSAGFSPQTIKKGETSANTITVDNDGTLDFTYDAGAVQTGGNPLLCQALWLTVTKGTTELYNGSLASFSEFVPSELTNSGTPDNLSFQIALPSSAPDSLQGEICQFKLDFDAWQINLSYGQGFEDEEELGNQISAGYWNPPIVLNEFLPNAGEYPEFIELYNQTGAAIDLDGFYIKADSNEIPIDAATTATYSGGLTTIAAHGWLVVTAGGDLMNNTSGIITLYNPNDVVVDTYTYNTADNNVNNNPGWTNNLVAYWPLDGNANDLSGNSNNGTVNGPIFVGGKINQGLSFDGTNDYVEVADSASLDIASQITVEGWIRPNAFNPSPTIAGKKLSYLLTIDTTGVPSFRISTDGSSTIEANGSTVTAGQWYHMVGTYDGSNLRLYINGVLVKTTSHTGTIFLNNEPLLIGAKDGWGGAGRKFTNGIVDEVKIYNRTLSDSEIMDHYNAAGAGGTVPTDKSYARIPDGSSNWVDPIPTPGAPNEIEQVMIETESTDVVSEQPAENSETTEPIIIEPVAEETEIQTFVEENSSSTEEVIVEEPAVLPEDDNEIVEEQQENTDSEETVPEQATETQDTEPVAEEIQEPVVLEQTTTETVIENVVPGNTTDQQTVTEQIIVAEPIQETISQ